MSLTQALKETDQREWLSLHKVAAQPIPQVFEVTLDARKVKIPHKILGEAKKHGTTNRLVYSYKLKEVMEHLAYVV